MIFYKNKFPEKIQDMDKKKVKITESPRDGMQSFERIIPLEQKIEYINLLMKTGFDTIDIGSFVSPKAVPAMADTGELIEALDMSNSDTSVSVLVGNERYAEKAVKYDKVSYVNYPFSVSEIFLQKNLRSNFEKAYKRIDQIIELCQKHGKTPIVTLSMAFGNPYGDEYSEEVLLRSIESLHKRGLGFIPLADTTAEADAAKISATFKVVRKSFPDTEFNLHLHTEPKDVSAKLEAAYQAGCQNFDSVFNGVGGCPMSGKKLTANTDTYLLYEFLESQKIPHNLKPDKMKEAARKASEVFSLDAQ